jgi:hypothetical protein
MVALTEPQAQHRYVPAILDLPFAEENATPIGERARAFPIRTRKTSGSRRRVQSLESDEVRLPRLVDRHTPGKRMKVRPSSFQRVTSQSHDLAGSDKRLGLQNAGAAYFQSF